MVNICINVFREQAVCQSSFPIEAILLLNCCHTNLYYMEQFFILKLQLLVCTILKVILSLFILCAAITAQTFGRCVLQNNERKLYMVLFQQFVMQKG